jgi:hypothetical protein
MTDPVVDAVTSSAELLNALLVSGLALAGVIVLLKIVGKDEFEVWKVPIKLKYAGAVFALFTVAHLYLAVLFIQDAYHIFFEHHELALDAWNTLHGKGFIFFHGMVARVQLNRVYIGGHPAYEVPMDWADPTTWLVHGAAILVFLAIVKWKNANWKLRTITLTSAFLIIVVNWTVGSNWVIAASELTLPQDQAIYLRSFLPR